MRYAIPLVVGAATIALAGCSAQSATTSVPSATPEISKQQSRALADGSVTWDEYKAGFDAYRSCLAKAGFTLLKPKRSDYLMDFGVPATAVESGDDARCYDYHWAQVDGDWQVAHDDVSETARWLAHCLQSKGITPMEKKADNEELIKSNGIDLAECPVFG